MAPMQAACCVCQRMLRCLPPIFAHAAECWWRCSRRPVWWMSLWQRRAAAAAATTRKARQHSGASRQRRRALQAAACLAGSAGCSGPAAAAAASCGRRAGCARCTPACRSSKRAPAGSRLWRRQRRSWQLACPQRGWMQRMWRPARSTAWPACWGARTGRRQRRCVALHLLPCQAWRQRLCPSAPSAPARRPTAGCCWRCLPSGPERCEAWCCNS